MSPKAPPQSIRVKDDDISDRKVFKNELEEGGNSGRIYGGTVGGTLGDQIYLS
jgi:hypothetical protein